MSAHATRGRVGLVLLALASPACKKTTPDPLPAAEIRSPLDQAVGLRGDPPFNGVVLVKRGDDTVYEVAVGFADKIASRPVDLDTGFIIGSLSKQFTVALVLRQVDAGALNLDSVVSSYRPDLREIWADSATLGQLLNHTSGVSDVPGESGGVPGNAFKYSNRGYDLLGEMLERATGRSFEEQLVEIVRSCGMQEMPIRGHVRLARGWG